MTSQNLLQQLRRLDRSSSRFHDRLTSILYGGMYNQRVQDLQGDDLAWLVDYLDTALDTLDPASPAFRKCLRELMHICGDRTILPSSYTLPSSLLNIGLQPVASGGSGDIFEGTLNGSSVCVKRVRTYPNHGPERATKTLHQEAVVWKRLLHPNIVPLLGITPTPLQLISEWMPGGDLVEHIKKHPDADRLGLLSDVAEGLRFLHSRNIVHRDLKGPNILVDATSHARITDFGFARVTQDLDSVQSDSSDQVLTARWTAPEILKQEEEYSKEADIFSFAMVMIEVFTGAIPFDNIAPAPAMFAITSGRRPPRPTHPALTEQLWTLIQSCWHQDPHSRPEISTVLNVLGSSETISPKQVSHPPPSPQESHGGSSQSIDGSELPSPLPTDPKPVSASETQKEAREHEEQLERERGEKELEEEEQERDTAKGVKETPKGEAPKPTDSATPEPLQNDVAHPPATQANTRFNIGILSPPSTISPAEMRRGPRILGLGGTASVVRSPNNGQSNWSGDQTPRDPSVGVPRQLGEPTQKPPTVCYQPHTQSVVHQLQSRSCHAASVMLDACSHTLSEGLSLGAPFLPQTEQQLLVVHGQGVSDPCVDGQIVVPVFTSNLPEATICVLESDRAASPSLLSRPRNGSRTPSVDAKPMVRENRKADARGPMEPAEHTRDTNFRSKNPFLRALRSCCCCQCLC